MKPILLVGATGFTGRLVLHSLMNLGLKDIVIAGRDERRVRDLAESNGGLSYRIGDATRPDSLRPMVDGMGVVIDTVGPFLQFGEPVVRAAVEAGAHFLDTTGEQAYMHSVLREFDATARKRGVAVVNAMAFEFALGYCAGAIVAEADSAIDTLDVFNRVRGHGVSRGTRKSAVAGLAAPALIRRDGDLVERGLSPTLMGVEIPPSQRLQLAIPFPGGEALHLPRTFPHLRNVTTNLVLPPTTARLGMALWMYRPVIGFLYRRGLLKPVMSLLDKTSDPSDEQRDHASFQVLARGRSRSGTQLALITGKDPYGITGVIAALGAKMLAEHDPLDVGVISTDRAFGATAFIRALEPHGVTLAHAPTPPGPTESPRPRVDLH